MLTVRCHPACRLVMMCEKTARRSVSVGPMRGGEREIAGGLRAGERVVLSPPASLKDGDAVTAADGAR